jgi:flagellin-like hook-associated protein FlgL
LVSKIEANTQNADQALAEIVELLQSMRAALDGKA